MSLLLRFLCICAAVCLVLWGLSELLPVTHLPAAIQKVVWVVSCVLGGLAVIGVLSGKIRFWPDPPA